MKNKIMFTHSNDKFKGFYHGIDMDPFVLIKRIEENCLGLSKLKEDHPFFEQRTLVDILTSLPEEKAQEYPDVLEAKNIIEKVIETMEYNFNLLIMENLHKGQALPKAYMNSLSSLIKISVNSFSLPEDISSSNPEESHDNFFAIESALSLIPEKLRINLDKIILNKDSKSKALQKDGKNIIVLNLTENLIFQMGEALHEYAHLIEKDNPSINTKTVNYLKTRILSEEKVSLADFCKANYKQCTKNSDILIYPTTLLDPYAGRTYGEGLTSETKTEILSIGLQALVLNPTNFLLRDPDFSNFILQTIRD